ncbi:MAG: histidinol-phosphatase HisJ family protein [Paramuribaculum sp.]|nr:histidinol-phosphatase HisJ family protein [Paramuribaculum sp.]
MDILNTIGSSEAYNFHSHTQFCDGRATMAEFAEAAVKLGLKHYGFSPHSPIPIPSPCNMSRDDVPAYLAEVKRLQNLYLESGTKFYAAMEIDYLGEEWGPNNPYFKNLGLDYAIGSVHFIPSQEGVLVDIDGRFENFKTKMSEYFHNDIRYVVDTFYAQSRKMIEAGGMEIVGHLDKVGHNAGHYCPDIESQPWYEQHVHDLIDLIASKGMVAELNTKAWEDHKRMFPNTRYLKRIMERKVPLIVNSDAHYPNLISASRAEGFAQMREAKLNIN